MPHGRSKWIAVLALGLVVGALVGNSAATGAITLPSTSVPGVQVPSTQLPPGAQLPGVTVPSTSLPSVQTPSTQAPGVRLPTPRLPSVSPPTTSPSTSTPGTKSQDGPTRLPSVQTLTNDTKLPTGSGPAQSLQTSSAIPAGSSGSGGSGGSSGNPGSGPPGSGGPGGSAGPGTVGGNGPNGLGGGASRLGGLGGISLLAATTAQLRSAIAPLRGCFYGLSRPERSVLNLRTGLAGRVPQTRRQVARRMGTSPRQVLRTEEQAIQKLNGLAQTDGCGTATSFGGVMVVNGIIGPAEIAASPSLVAFGNPAYQGLEQSSFSRLGPGLGLGSLAPLPANFGAGSTNGSTWAFQLLAIMLLVALGGFYKFIPVVAARLRHRTHPRGTPFDFESGQMSELELDRAPGGELPSERQREKIAA